MLSSCPINRGASRGSLSCGPIAGTSLLRELVVLEVPAMWRESRFGFIQEILQMKLRYEQMFDRFKFGATEGTNRGYRTTERSK